MSIEFLLVMVTMISFAQADGNDFLVAPDGSFLMSGSSMAIGDHLYSKSRQYILSFDGNLHMKQWTVDSWSPEGWYGIIVWSICSNQTGAAFTLRYDGNLVLKDASGNWLWSHDQNRGGEELSPYFVMLGDNGVLLEYSQTKFMVWNSSDPDTQNSGAQSAKFQYGDCSNVQW